MKKYLFPILKFLCTVVICIVILIALLVGGIYVFSVIKEREFEKYGGHGFEYMHGYSSTDFTGYHVYDGEKLVTLDHDPEFMIEDEENMPVLDGAEACYPVYCAFAKAVYKDIDLIEGEVQSYADKDHKDWTDDQIKEFYDNGRIVTFTNSSVGYDRLIYGEVDLFIGARPSKGQLAEAEENGVKIVSVPIGKEAFVFFVEEDNPIDDLSSDDIRKIYSGEIANWKELGGKNQKIVAFQRPENSGSQVMMRYFMKDVELKEADTMERISAMGGVVKQVKQYHNENGAIGYTFRYFLEELNQEEGVKMLSVDGVYPSVENIKNGTYPILADLVVSKLEGNEKEYVDRMIEFMLSKDGQYIIEKTGYGPLE
ncbi:MAG: substrate-binding domain-containing protein [Erysipelotrichaceae bacterium]|nr:substrate-binding domain-containing protein [Erysipelotrichaceae bacterium]